MPRPVDSPSRNVDNQARLLHDAKMESLGRLAGGVAHDFNNLLTAIITATRQAARAPAVRGTSTGALLDIALDAANRASRLTRQLLTFAHSPGECESVCDLDELIGSLREPLRELVGGDVELVFELGAPSSFVRAAPDELEQLLVNLTLNARDAMPTGGRLRIVTRCVGRGGEDLEVVVSDSGCGIPPEQLDHIYDPFFTTKSTGSGLGLATSYGIVRRMRGTIDCRSEVGTGTEFRIRLPRERIEAAPPQPLEPCEGNGETVLLIDDNDLARRALESALGAFGYDVRSAAGAHEALALAHASGPFDVVVSDVVMDEMRGPQLARELRALHPGVPVLFISGYTADALHDDDLGEGEELLAKPFTVDVLAEAIQRVLLRARDGNGAHGHSEGSRSSPPLTSQ